MRLSITKSNQPVATMLCLYNVPIYKFDVKTHDESETTLQDYETVGCSR